MNRLAQRHGLAFVSRFGGHEHCCLRFVLRAAAAVFVFVFAVRVRVRAQDGCATPGVATARNLTITDNIRGICKYTAQLEMSHRPIAR